MVQLNNWMDAKPSQACQNEKIQLYEKGKKPFKSRHAFNKLRITHLIQSAWQINNERCVLARSTYPCIFLFFKSLSARWSRRISNIAKRMKRKRKKTLWSGRKKEEKTRWEYIERWQSARLSKRRSICIVSQVGSH